MSQETDEIWQHLRELSNSPDTKPDRCLHSTDGMNYYRHGFWNAVIAELGALRSFNLLDNSQLIVMENIRARLKTIDLRVPDLPDPTFDEDNLRVRFTSEDVTFIKNSLVKLLGEPDAR